MSGKKALSPVRACADLLLHKHTRAPLVHVRQVISRNSVPNRCQEPVSRVGAFHWAIDVFHDDLTHCSEIVRAHGLQRRRPFGREPE